MTPAKKPKPKPLPKCPLCGRSDLLVSRSYWRAMDWFIRCNNYRDHSIAVVGNTRRAAERRWRKLASRKP